MAYILLQTGGKLALEGGGFLKLNIADLTGGLIKYRSQRKQAIKKAIKQTETALKQKALEKIQEISLKKQAQTENLRQIIEVELPEVIEHDITTQRIENQRRKLQELQDKEEEAIIAWLLMDDD